MLDWPELQQEKESLNIDSDLSPIKAPAALLGQDWGNGDLGNPGLYFYRNKAFNNIPFFHASFKKFLFSGRHRSPFHKQHMEEKKPPLPLVTRVAKLSNILSQNFHGINGLNF